MGPAPDTSTTQKAAGNTAPAGRRPHPPGLTLLLLAFMTGMAGCRQPDLVPAHYYLLLQAINPLSPTERPTRPDPLNIRYQALLKEIILEWGPSSTKAPFLAYYVYAYLDQRPTACCAAEYRLAETATTTHSLSATPYTGSIYFQVTAFDGWRESEGSPVRGLNLMQDPVEVFPD